MIAEIVKDAESKMTGAVDYAKQDLSTIRTGRAQPEMFAKLHADYYGTPTPIQQLVSFNSPEARTMLITPYDMSALPAIERAIRDSDLGVAPSNDGHSIRVVLPELTEQRRKEFSKLAKAKAEEGKVAVRNIRRHANEAIKKLEKDKEISEDDAKRGEKQLDDLTKKYSDQVDAMVKVKEAELMAV
jgi:ribosome recycling factor